MEDELELSFQQEKVWDIYRRAPKNRLFDISPMAIVARGHIDEWRLGAAVSYMIGRHESLRTYFSLTEGKQIIAESAAARINVADFSALPNCDQVPAARRRLVEEIREPFDIATPPLFRVGVMNLGQGRSVLFFRMHHLISDLISMQIFAREVVHVYGRLGCQPSIEVREPQRQYRDFVKWQRHELQQDVFRRHVKFWQTQCVRGSKLTSVVPAKAARTGASTLGQVASLTIAAALIQSATELSRAQGVTPFMTLLSAFAVLLHLHTGVNDVLVHTRVGGRTRPESRGVIGFFAHGLLLRLKIHKSDTFADVLARVRDVCVEAYNHQDVPYYAMPLEGREADEKQLAPVSFSLQRGIGGTTGEGDEYWQPFETTGMSLLENEPDSVDAQFELGWEIWPLRAGIRVVIVYRTACFERAEINEMLLDYQAILAEVSGLLGLSIHELPAILVRNHSERPVSKGVAH